MTTRPIAASQASRRTTSGRMGPMGSRSWRADVRSPVGIPANVDVDDDVEVDRPVGALDQLDECVGSACSGGAGVAGVGWFVVLSERGEERGAAFGVEKSVDPH